MGADARRLPDDEPLGRRAPARAAAPASAAGHALYPRATRPPDRAQVQIAGMVVARQRPSTANGVVFMLLEDEYAQVNLIVPPQVYERFRAVVRDEPLLLARGRYEHSDRNRNVLVEEVVSLGPLAHELTEGVDVHASLPGAHHFGHR